MFAAINSFLTGGASEAKDPYWANVSMLLHGDGVNAAQNNTFLDGSTNNFTVTRNGNTTQGSFNPFVSTYPYSVATNGGSAYFDGTGDYLSVPNNAAFSFGTGDFTIEMWVYPKSFAGFNTLIDARSVGTASSYGLFTDSSTGKIYWYDASGVQLSSSGLTLNAWAHVAVSRTSGVLKLFIAGVQVYSAANTNAQNPTGNFVIGRNIESSPVYFTGYMSNLRVVNGTGLYTSNFTPPTAPLTAVTNTALLLGMSNGAIYDNAILNNLETVADAQISTSVFKYGTGSMKFDGTGDRLSTPAKTAFALGSGDFTIECWVNSAFVGNGGVAGQRDDAGTPALSSFYMLGIGTSLRCGFYVSATPYEISVTMTANVWSHVAFVRDGATTRVYVNGVQQGTAAVSTVVVNTSIYPVQLGTTGDTVFFYNGYIDDFRFTKGICRYPSGTTFTPPTAAFPNS
jgi:hypothetical protein